MDVVALGELLIDFTENGISSQGNPLYRLMVPRIRTGVFLSIYSFRILVNNSSFRMIPALFSFSSAIMDRPFRCL